MSALLPDWLRNVVMSAILILFVLAWAARRYPQFEWLRAFKLPELNPAQRARRKRASDIHAGIEVILLGVLMVPGYFVVTLMTWGDPSRGMLIAVGALSVACITLGVWAIARAVRSSAGRDDRNNQEWP
jgi:hypothetical protein